MKTISDYITESISINALSHKLDKAEKAINNIAVLKEMEKNNDPEYPDDIFGGSEEEFLQDRQNVCIEIIHCIREILPRTGKIEDDIEEQITNSLDAMEIEKEFHDEYSDYMDFVFYTVWPYLFRKDFFKDVK